MLTANRRRTLTTLTLLSLLWLTPNALAVDPDGAWEGAIEIPGTLLAYSVEFTRDSTGALTATADIPAQNAADLPVEGIIATDDSLIFVLSGIPGAPTFRGAFSDDSTTVAGDFTQGGQSFPFSMIRLDAATEAARAANLNETLAQIRTFIDTTLPPWKVPGLAIAIIKDDSLLMLEGFGLRNIEDSLPVTPQTLFPVGSSTKAFTTTALAMLADSGLVDWNARVHTYLPDFRLADPFITEHATVRDLVTHRIGLPRHDLMWYSSAFTRDEMFRRLRYLDFSEDFRTHFQYQNLMFMTAGLLAGRVANTTWENFVRDRIFTPLGMTNSNFSIARMQETSDYALGYGEEDDTITLMPYRPIDAIGPAGSINSSADQMVNWLRLHVNNGEFSGSRLVSEAQMIEMHSPFVTLDRAGGRYNETILSSYGLGWFVESYRGHYRVQHGGNIDGFSAVVSFLPNDRIGSVILTNKNGTPLPSIVAHYVDDLLLDLEPVGYHNRVLSALAAADSAQGTAEEAAADRVADTKPSHDLKAYEGEYEHPGYGVIYVNLADNMLKKSDESRESLGSEKSGSAAAAGQSAKDRPAKQSTKKGNPLHLALHDLESGIEHWHYDVFRLTDEPFASEQSRSFVTFATNTFGDIDRLSLVLEPTLDPIVFIRRPDSRLSEPAYLAQFVGEYELMKMTVAVEIQSDHLTVTVPGQPTYTLLPYRDDEFTFRDLSGYSVAFARDKSGAITALKFKQPNGVFTAERQEM